MIVALGSNTTGNDNTATGEQRFSSNITGVRQHSYRLSSRSHSNTTGFNNTAIGDRALVFSNTVGNVNTATGLDALLE